MLDFHIHTIYSDGKLLPNYIVDLADKYNRLSVTDHNTIGFYLYLYENYSDYHSLCNKFRIGTELTIEGEPDYLLYLPYDSHTTAPQLDKLYEFENILTSIRLTEEIAVKEAYYILGFKTWDEDIKNVKQSRKIHIEARTMDLAVICASKRKKTAIKPGSGFEQIDLRLAREARRMAGKKLQLSYARPFDVALSNECYIVLAHPIRTAIKQNRNCDIEMLLSNLEQILKSFAECGGKTVEWEYLDGELSGVSDRYPVLNNHFNDVRNTVKNAVNRFDFQCIWGSDTHDIKINHELYKKWNFFNMSTLSQSIPEWFS